METITIKHTTCDCCGARSTCAEWHDDGIPHFAACKACQPVAFEAQARQDIDSWLSGEDTFGEDLRDLIQADNT